MEQDLKAAGPELRMAGNSVRRYRHACSGIKGDPNKAAWLPNEALAKIWMEYARTGTVSDSRAPPAPFNVRDESNDANHGNEITWEAEADIVSEFGGFMVLRDGRGIAKVQRNLRKRCMDAHFRGSHTTTRRRTAPSDEPR